jgi:uncharacterized protein (DUF1015 family)
MPAFEPFSGLRYDLSRLRLDNVICPPYDVVSPKERQELASKDPHNAIEIELPEGGPDRYEKAAKLLRSWLDSGILVQDPSPCFYAYRMTYRDPAGSGERQTLGVIGALGLGSDDILPHEETLPKAKTDRLELIRALRLNTSPIWGLSLAQGLSEVIEPQGDPLASARDRFATHELWALPEVASELISKIVASAPLVVADGHHRLETARNYRSEKAPLGPGPWDAVMAFVVELSESQLAVGAIHRLLRGFGSTEELLEHLETSFEIDELGRLSDPTPASLSPVRLGGAVLVVGDRAWVLVRRPWPAEPLADFDSAAVARATSQLASLEVSYVNSVEDALLALSAGEAEASLLLRPPSVAQIRQMAEAGRKMPPKTTFFWPKPATGLVFRSVS